MPRRIRLGYHRYNHELELHWALRSWLSGLLNLLGLTPFINILFCRCNILKQPLFVLASCKHA
jgi:hypothetical protein